MFDIVLYCSVLVFYILCSWIPHFVPCCHDYYITKVFIKIVKYKSGDHHVNKLTDNDFNKINYIDHFVVIFLNPTYYASIMLDALNNILCSKLCWHNRPGPIYKQFQFISNVILTHNRPGPIYKQFQFISNVMLTHNRPGPIYKQFQFISNVMLTHNRPGPIYKQFQFISNVMLTHNRPGPIYK